VSASGLIHYWPLDEASGATVTDVVGGWESTVVHDDAAGTDTVVEAWIGNGRLLAKDSANHGYIRLWTGSEDLTYSFPEWSVGVTFSHPEIGLNFAMLWTIGDIGTTDANYVFITEDTIEFGLESEDGLVDEYEFALADVDDDNPHQAILSCDGESTRLYLDGVLVATAAAALPLQLKQSLAEIGGLGEMGWNAGWVDEVQVWDRALNAADAQALWADGDGLSALDYAALFEPPDTSWADALTTEQRYYALEIDDGALDPIRIPISSWQATIQLDRASYGQAVIPGALPWVDAIDARADGEFVIYRGVRYPNGDTQEIEIARVPMQQVDLDQGPTNATIRLSGYWVEPPPLSSLTRTLHNVRSRSVGRGLRVRCDIDWFLRPGFTASVDNGSFTVRYINYYANASDEYMDVGEQVL
jgi:hypothetical protein